MFRFRPGLIAAALPAEFDPVRAGGGRRATLANVVAVEVSKPGEDAAASAAEVGEVQRQDTPGARNGGYFVPDGETRRLVPGAGKHTQIGTNAQFSAGRSLAIDDRGDARPHLSH